jgi:hypothetical protein
MDTRSGVELRMENGGVGWGGGGRRRRRSMEEGGVEVILGNRRWA